MRVREAPLGWRKQLLSGAVSLLQKQLPLGASNHLAPAQCQAPEAKAEELSPPPPPITFGVRGRGVPRLPVCTLPGLFFQPIPAGV